MKSKKRPLSLLEVAIGLALTTVLLTSLFGTFRHIIQANLGVQKVRASIHQRSVTHLRLTHIFNAVQSQNSLKFFYTSPYDEAVGNALFFFYDNGIDPDKAFCQTVSGILFRDQKDHLCLVTKPQKGSPRKEILLTGASQLDFSYYDIEEKKWVNEWGKKTFPAFIKLQTESEEYLFKILSSSYKIDYS